jgi:HAD superfamily hydrolase (TIGR01549 family)
VKAGIELIFMNHIKAIFFDIGGTLVQKQNHGFRDPVIFSKLVNFLQADCSPEEMATKITLRENAYKSWRGQSLNELSYADRWTKFLLPDYPQDFIRQNAEQLQAWWRESRGKHWITAETIHTLQELYDRGYILGSISHSSVRYLDDAGIRALFTVSIQAAEYGKRKPHPSPFLAAARGCGVSPAECAYVGDRPSRDVVGSREAGFGQVILLKREGQLDEGIPCPMQADVVIHDLPEILDCFPNRNSLNPQKSAQPEAEILYDAALSTLWWSKDRDSANEFSAKGRNLGFARFELNHQVSLSDLAAFDLNRYHIGSLHDPCPALIPNKQLEREDRQITSLDETLRRSGVDTVKRTVEQAYQLGARSVIIHPGRITGDHTPDDQLRVLYRKGLKGSAEYEALRAHTITDRKKRSRPHLEALLTSLQELVDFAQKSGILLGLENRYHYYELPIFEEMEILMENFRQPWIGWQLDVGHIQTHDALGLMSFQQWLERFAGRIIGVHLHDVQGIVDHRVPGCGDVDFHGLSKYLPADAIRTLEVDKSVSMEEFRGGLKLLQESGCIARL